MVFSSTYPEMLKEFRTAAKKLQVSAVPYQARHSGASIDAALELRTRTEIKARGRWTMGQKTNVARYESKARLAESLDKLPSVLLVHLKQCGHRVEVLLCGRCNPGVLPLPRLKST
jgi:hypothetical protein